MSDFIQFFLNSVAPVAFVFFLGYLTGKRGSFLNSDASGIFKFIANITKKIRFILLHSYFFFFQAFDINN